MRSLELIAAGVGIASVFLSTRQHIASWPTALVNVILYGVYFFQQKLYALMGLQGFFAAVSLYGWYLWLYGGESKSQLKVSHTPPRVGATLAALATLGTLVLARVLERHTPDPQPWADAALTAVSLVGQWMMARKLLECWVIWIGVNLVSVPFFFLRAEYPTAVQYGAFLLLAVSGLYQWNRSLAASS